MLIASADAVAPPRAPADDALVIVTLTQNAEGKRRIYLGGKSSLECWIEPSQDGRRWSFHLEEAVTGNRLSEEARRAWALHTLRDLAAMLSVAPKELPVVPFENIARLHTEDPYLTRRMSAPKRRVAENGFVPVGPNAPSHPEFSARSYTAARHRPR